LKLLSETQDVRQPGSGLEVNCHCNVFAAYSQSEQAVHDEELRVLFEGVKGVARGIPVVLSNTTCAVACRM
jgi:hypothetical protein